VNWIVPAGADVDVRVYVPIAIACILLAGIAKAGFGGLGVAIMPLLLAALPDARIAAGLWLPLLLACDVLTYRKYTRECAWRPILLLAPGTLAASTAHMIWPKGISPSAIQT